MYFGCFKYVHDESKHKIELTIYVHTKFSNPDKDFGQQFL